MDDFEIRCLSQPRILNEIYYEEKIPDLIFADGFETSDFSLWTSSETDSGDLSIDSASYYGDYGIKFVIDDYADIHLHKDLGSNQTQITAGLFLKRDGLSMGLGNQIKFIEFVNDMDETIAYARIVRRKNIGHLISFHAKNDSGTFVATGEYTFSTGWHSVQLVWKAATAAGADDGSVSLYVDGVLKQTKTGIDNDTISIQSIDLCARGRSGYTTGTFNVDNLEVWKTTMPLLEPIAIPEFWLTNEHTYSDLQPHAVTEVVREVSVDVFETDTYTYDANGNMVTAIETNGNAYVYSYNPENRLSVVNNVTTNEQWYFTYDGDGVRVMEDYRSIGVTEYYRYFFAGGSYEVTDDVTAADNDIIKHYYHFAGQMIASHDGINWNFFASDHLSSASLVMDTLGAVLSENRYMPYGEVRTDTSLTAITETDFGYTGQREYKSFGLMDYNARFYSHYLKHFCQPDPIIPGIGAMALNRYMYVMGNPVNFNDPSGHSICEFGEVCFSGGGNNNVMPNLKTDDLYDSISEILYKEFNVFLDTKFTDNQRNSIGVVVVEIDVKLKEYGSTFQSAFGSDGIFITKDKARLNLLGQAPNESNLTFFVNGNDDLDFGNIIHEFGHILDFRLGTLYEESIPKLFMMGLGSGQLYSTGYDYGEYSSGFMEDFYYGEYQHEFVPNNYVELYADMFVMLVLDHDITKMNNYSPLEKESYRQRYNWMNNFMTNYLP